VREGRELSLGNGLWRGIDAFTGSFYVTNIYISVLLGALEFVDLPGVKPSQTSKERI
jgi:hypothetical protein